MRSLLLVVLFIFVPRSVAGSELEFEGIPSVRIDTFEGATRALPVPTRSAQNLRVQVVRSGDEYLWASRDNVPMIKRESGIYITYVAVTGAGYVRVLNADMRRAIRTLPPEQQAKEFIYTEHMIDRLGSITYFGR